MFSGIVQETGKVIEFVKEKDIYNLSIDCSSDLLSDLKKGASISVNGVCLTAVSYTHLPLPTLLLV